MIPKANRNSGSGFTLVELLVVIAIIAILAALAFPAFNSVTSHARTAKCASNLRNIATAMLSFAADNNGNLPVSGSVIPWDQIDGTTKQNGWCQQIGTYVGVTVDPTTTGPTIFQCPDWNLVSNNKYYSYFNGSHAGGTGSPVSFGAVNLMKMKAPSVHIIAGDIAFNLAWFSLNDADKDDYNPQDPPFNGGTPTAPTTIPIHGGSSNVAFADGHVENLRSYDNANVTTHYAGLENKTYSYQDQ